MEIDILNDICKRQNRGSVNSCIGIRRVHISRCAKKEISPSECVILVDVEMQNDSIRSKYVQVQLISSKNGGHTV
jgi:hypothetical protein